MYFLCAKSNVANILPGFFTLILTQFGAKIKSVRSDNAPKLAFIDFFQTHGVQVFHSYVATPQQNFVVECKHQHILNVAQALFFQSHIPLCYWNDCATTSAYLIIKTPSPMLSNNTL